MSKGFYMPLLGNNGVFHLYSGVPSKLLTDSCKSMLETGSALETGQEDFSSFSELKDFHLNYYFGCSYLQ